MNYRESIIRSRAASVGMSISQLADRTGIRRQTLYDRLRNPDRLTACELRSICRFIRLSDEELVAMVRRSD